MKRLLDIAAGIGLGLIASSTAIAQTPGSPVDSDTVSPVGRMGDVQILAGVRLWANEWDMGLQGRELSVDPANPGTTVARDRVFSSLTDLKVVPMPTIAASYGRFLGSVTYFVPTSYRAEGGLRKSVERSEVDVTAGYFVLPSLLVSLGYKYATVERVLDDVDSKQTISGLLLGASGSAPLSDRWSLYGSLAYGLARQKSEVKDARGEDKYSATYTIGEVGLGYRLPDSVAGSFVKSVTAQVGYRAQTYTTEDVGLGTYALSAPTVPISTDTRDVRTTTNGIVVSLIALF